LEALGEQEAADPSCPAHSGDSGDAHRTFRWYPEAAQDFRLKWPEVGTWKQNITKAYGRIAKIWLTF